MWGGGRMARPDATEVIPGLRVGAELSARGRRALVRQGVTHVVDLRTGARRMPHWPAGVALVGYPMAEYEAPDLSIVDQASAQAARLINDGAIVYIHCRAGVQRSPLVACAVLMQMGWGLSDAYQLIRSRRTLTAISEAQLAVLTKLEVLLRSRQVSDGAVH